MQGRCKSKKFGLSLWLVGFVAILIVGANSNAFGEGGYEFVEKWPATPRDWYFVDPADVAIDSNGNVYVVEEDGEQVLKFDSSMNFIKTWNRNFDGPEGIAVDSAGNIYVADEGNHRIQKFDSDGNFLLEWGGYGTGDGQFTEPEGITVDSNGYVYVVEGEGNGWNNARVQKFTGSGTFLFKWGSYGTGDGQFQDPCGIAVDSAGYVYVVDEERKCIQKFTGTGTFVLKWNSGRTARITIDSNDYIYAPDEDTHCVKKYDTNGNLITSWGSSGMGDGKFLCPWGVDTDTSGNIWISDRWGWIQKFTNTGGFLDRWGNPTGDGEFNFPVDLDIDSNGNIYVLDTGNFRIQKFDSHFNSLLKWGSFGTETGKFEGQPQGIACDSSGNIYTVEEDPPCIQKFDSNGNFLLKWGSFGTQNGQFNTPEGGIDIDSAGNVYVTDDDNHRVQKFDSNGNFLLKWGSFGTQNGQFIEPMGIAVDSDDYVYVATEYYIQKFDSNGIFILKWGSEGIGSGQFNEIKHICVDSLNNIYTVDEENNCIQKFDSNGNFITKWGTEGSGDGQFKYPIGIAVDSAGNVYVADTVNFRIQKFAQVGGTITGTISYTGTKTGVLNVGVFDSIEMAGDPVYGTQITNPAFPQTYTVSNIPSGTYYVAAFLDADNTGNPSIGDPIGMYGSLTAAHLFNGTLTIIGTPTPVYVSAGSITSGRDFELTKEIESGTPTPPTTGSVTVYDSSGGFIGTYTTIQSGINACPIKGTVKVATGTYQEAIYINTTFSLIGQGADVCTITSVGLGNTNTVTFDNADGTITGFTITGASGDWPIGNGIYCQNGATPTITHNTISGNSACGIACDFSSPNITNNTIVGNNEHGIYCYNSSSAITNNIIYGNNNGDGINCNYSSGTITNNIIYSNNYGIGCHHSSQ